jgi:pimeloyl-ACP methyl ester carboxylesterase
MKRLSPLFPLLGAVAWLVYAGCSPEPRSTNHPTLMNASYYTYDVETLTLPSGQEMAYTDTGHGPRTLLLVHGLGSYLPVYDKLIPLLADEFRCVAVDLPGFGRSGWPVDSVSIPFFAQQLEEFIQTMDLERVTLLGHSMGGQISLRVALDGLVPLEQLVLLAPAGIETFTTKEAVQLKQVITPNSIYALKPKQIRQNFAVNFTGGQLPDDAAFMYEDRLRLKADSTSYRRFAKHFPRCVAAMLEGPVYAELDQLSLPALVIYGENDALIPNRYLHPGLTTAAVADSAQAALPQAEVKILPDCGHFVPWEQAEPVSEAIRAFVPPVQAEATAQPPTHRLLSTLRQFFHLNKKL